MSVEVKQQLVKKEEGVTFVKNVFVDSERVYNRKEARKRKGMLDAYSIESQINIMRKAILTLAEKSGVELPELQAIETLAVELGIN